MFVIFMKVRQEKQKKIDNRQKDTQIGIQAYRCTGRQIETQTDDE